MQKGIVWEIKDPEKKRAATETITRERKPAPQARTRGEKNPALAFTLSILVWGGGQFYNRQWKLGSLFVLLMVNFCIDLLLILMYWTHGLSSLITSRVGPFAATAACGIFYASGIFFWFLSAVHAYHRAAKTRKDRFNGIELAFLPPLLSLLIPGWGQFLNGQVKKGVLFLLAAAAGLLAVPFCVLFPLFWSAAGTAGQHLFLEWGLIIAISLVPLILLTWLFGIFDALKVALDDIKKEPLRKRIRYAINRVRMQGLVRGVMPHARLTAFLGILLAISLLFSYLVFPRAYYAASLQRMQARMSQEQMVLIPSLTNWLLEGASPAESDPGTRPDVSGLNI